MSGQRVKFHGSGSPPGGSSRSSRHAYSSDSGVGSSSDNEHSRRPANNPDGGYAAPADQSQWNDLAALQGSYRMIYDENVRLKHDNDNKRQDILDLQDRNQRLQDKNERLSRDADRNADTLRSLEKDSQRLADDKKRLEDAIKNLSEKNRAIDAERAQLRAMNDHLQLKLAEATVVPPSSGSTSSNVATAGASSSNVHRSSSKREKERLSQRFERDEGKPKPSGGRYVEPYGPGPTQPAMTRVFDNYSTTPMATPVMAAPLASPTYSNIPRSTTLPVRPYITVPAEPVLPPRGPVEDGNYHPHPLPRERKR